MTAQSELRQAHADLLASYKEIQQEFADLDDQTLASFLGKFDSPELRQQVREHGDGYTMRSVPSCAEEILQADVLVLIVMNSPLLNNDSVFTLHAPLTDIPYWRRKGLRSEARLKNGSLHRFQFLVWEQLCAFHGKSIRGESTKDARVNQRLLFEQRPRLRELIPEQEQKSEKLLLACKDWLEGLGERLVVLTNARKKELSPKIEQLMSGEGDTILHIRTELFKANRTITVMDEIIATVTEVSS